jgi:glucan-binding YG repeat protein
MSAFAATMAVSSVPISGVMGSASIAYASAHEFEFQNNGSSLVAHCKEDPGVCDLTEEPSISVSAPTEAGAAATITKTENFNGLTGLENSSPVYYSAVDNGDGLEKTGEPLPGVPTEPGNYIVEVWVSRADPQFSTAISVAYTIPNQEQDPVHEHSFSFTNENGTFTAECSGGDGCTLEGPLTLSLTAPAVPGGEASIVKSDGFTEETGLSHSQVFYYKATGTDGSFVKDGEALASAPNAAGDYIAEVYISNAEKGLYFPVSVHYSIDATDPTVTEMPEAVEGLFYDGSAQKAVTDGLADGGTFVFSATEDGEYSEDIDGAIRSFKEAGDHEVWCKVAGDELHNDTEPVKITAHISPKELDDQLCSLYLSTTSFVYDGTEKEPAVTVIAGGVELVEGTDYDVTYENNVHVGTDGTEPTAIASFKGNYAGEASIAFEIRKAKQDVEWPQAASGLHYTGQEQSLLSLLPSVPDGCDLLYKVDDGEWSDEEPVAVDAGEHTVAWKSLGNGDYEDFNPGESLTVAIAKAWAPEAADFDASELPSAPALVYNGSKQDLVKLPEELPEGYTAVLFSPDGDEWTDKMPTAVEAGSYGVHICYVGDENHEDLVLGVLPVYIARRPLDASMVTVVNDGEVYSGEPIEPLVLTLDIVDGEDIITDDDYSVSGDAPETDVSPTGYIVTVTASADGNYSGRVSKTWNIAPKPMDDVEAELADDGEIFSDGEAKYPDLIVTDDGEELEYGDDYDVYYEQKTDNGWKTVEDPTEPGDYRAVLVFNGNYDDNGKRMSVPFSIVAPPEKSVPSLSKRKVPRVLESGMEADLSKAVSGAGEVSYKLMGAPAGTAIDEDGKIVAGDVPGEAVVVISCAEDDAHEAAEFTVRISIRAKDPEPEPEPFEGWHEWHGLWSYVTDGGLVTGWFCDPETGLWYHFDDEGVMETGWFCDSDGQWYWLSESHDGKYGHMVEGFFETGGKRYLAVSDGMLAPLYGGWFEMNGLWYHFHTEHDGHFGEMDTGWVLSEGKWYWLGEDGIMTRNRWIKWNGSWYWLKQDGSMARSEWVKGNGNWYWLKQDGSMARSEWVTWHGNDYWLDSDGAMVSDVTIEIGGKTYSFDARGARK